MPESVATVRARIKAIIIILVALVLGVVLGRGGLFLRIGNWGVLANVWGGLNIRDAQIYIDKQLKKQKKSTLC